MTTITRERLVNAAIAICMIICASLFVYYVSANYTRDYVEEFNNIQNQNVLNKMDEIGCKLDSLNSNLLKIIR